MQRQDMLPVIQTFHRPNKKHDKSLAGPSNFRRNKSTYMVLIVKLLTER